MGHHAAAMTYYAMLSLFPALIIGVAALGLFGQQATVHDVTAYLTRNGAPDAVTAPVRSLMFNAVRAGGRSNGVALVTGLLLAMYGASGTFAAARRALNVAYGVQEDRSFVHRKLGDFGWTLVLIALGLLALIGVFLGGGVADDLFRALGLHGAGSVWAIARWPVAFVVMLAAFSIVYAKAPDISPRRWRIVTPGGIVGVALWIVASLGLFVFLGHISSLSAYGPFGGAVVLLLWIWLSMSALLLGAELNAVATRADRARCAASAPPDTGTAPPEPDTSHTARRAVGP